MEMMHKYSSEQKIEWFGQGEWVEEADFAIEETKSIAEQAKKAFEVVNDNAPD
jgi:hypothetical protein